MAAISAARAGATSTIAPCGASAASSGSSVGSTEPAPAKKRNSSASSRPIIRSRQPAPARMNWRMGTASNSSLPTMSSGACGSVSMVSCQPIPADVPASVCFWISVSRGLVSIMANDAPAVSAGSSRDRVRSMSFISVPRPGPISAMVTGIGRPIASQAW